LLQVQPKGRASAQGIEAGDRIVAICGIPTHDKSHAEIKSEMLRAGNDLDLTVLRYCIQALNDTAICAVYNPQAYTVNE